MQCDISNIILDTGPVDSSGVPSRADSNITTPANYRSDDNDDLDEQTSAKNSVNHSRESSVPPDDKRRENIMKKSKGVVGVV